MRLLDYYSLYCDDNSDTLSDGFGYLQLLENITFFVVHRRWQWYTANRVINDSQNTVTNGDKFWSYDLHPIEIAQNIEQVGRDNTLLPEDAMLKYFYLILNEDFFETATRDTKGMLNRKWLVKVPAIQFGTPQLVRNEECN